MRAKDLESNITHILKASGTDFICFVDISELSAHQNRGYPIAILFGISLTPNYVKVVIETPNYVEDKIARQDDFQDDELYSKELKTDELSDKVAEYINDNGYKALSHSDKSQIACGTYDGIYGETILPHKTIAVLAGIGWIGKNNLLVTSEFGSALCLGVILTDLPVQIVKSEPLNTKCENCNQCLDVCNPQVLTGCFWKNGLQRKDMIDVYNCTTCMKCLVHCSFTQKYINANL
ncbi:MAG: epoxyqueuosine reductase [Odoribacter sp.]|nr:epoxyqueuosine reductase [Odoribacter sp.]